MDLAGKLEVPQLDVQPSPNRHPTTIEHNAVHENGAQEGRRPLTDRREGSGYCPGRRPEANIRWSTRPGSHFPEPL